MKKSKLIIHTEAASGWGGQEIRTFTESVWFREQGHEVVLLAREGTPIWERFKEAGFETIHFSFNKKSQIKDLISCYNLCKERQPDIMATHSNLDSKACLLGSYLAKVPKRIRYRHVSLPVRASFLNKVIYRKWATEVITTGECIALPLIKDLGLERSRVHTISTGISVPEVLPSREKAHEDLCKQLGLPNDSRFIGQVSVLRGWKGHRDVMEAFDLIGNDFPNCHLVFVGGGHGEEYLPPIAKSKTHGSRIHFLGYQADPWPYFRALEANILASIEGEGIPQVGMQAMLSETPFVGTRVGGIPEIIIDRETGYLVSPQNPQELAKVLGEVLSNRSQAQLIAKKAFEWALENCLVGQMGEKVDRVIRS